MWLDDLIYNYDWTNFQREADKILASMGAQRLKEEPTKIIGGGRFGFLEVPDKYPKGGYIWADTFYPYGDLTAEQRSAVRDLAIRWVLRGHKVQAVDISPYLSDKILARIGFMFPVCASAVPFEGVVVVGGVAWPATPEVVSLDRLEFRLSLRY